MNRLLGPDAFREAVKVKASAKEVFETLGIKAEYSLSITDMGPVLEVRVSENSYNSARLALLSTNGAAMVRIIKK